MEPVGEDQGHRARRFAGATLATSPFAGDTGEVPAAVAAALAAYAADPGRYPEVLAALRDGRLLVPVAAVLDEAGADHYGRATEKASALAAVFLQGRDGRRALLAFTGLEPLHAWRLDARPVPTATPEAARTALHEGAEAVVVDLAGPVRFVIEGEALAALAAGWRPGRVGDQPVWVGVDRNPRPGRHGIGPAGE